MNARPFISLIVPISCNDQFAFFLSSNHASVNHQNVEIIGVQGDADAFNKALSNDRSVCVKRCLLEETAHSRALALNVGAYVSTGSHLLFIDDSVKFSSDLPSAVTALVEGQKYIIAKTVRTADRLVLPESSLLRKVIRRTRLHASWSDDTQSEISYLCSDLLNGERAGYSILGITREHFKLVGGYDSNLLGSGWENADIHLRLESVLGLKWCAVGECDERQVTTNSLKTSGRQGNISETHFQQLLERYTAGGQIGTYHADVQLYKNRVKIKS